MQKRFTNIFTITLLSICLFGANVYAQEGEDIPEKQESEVLEKDSVSNEEVGLEEPKGEIPAIVITPASKDQRLLLPEGDINIAKPSVKPVTPTNGDKLKEQDSKSPSLRFNLLYYLFYKVKVGSTSASGN